MAKTAADFEREIVHALRTFAFGEVNTLCTELIGSLPRLKPFPDAAAKNILNQLRRKRRFSALERVAHAFFRNDQRSAKVQLLHVQSLLDQNAIDEGLAALDPLLGALKGDDLEEAHGLVGRAHKQRYVNRPGAPDAARSLVRSIDAYWARYKDDPRLIWHGINVVALLVRAEKDQIPISSVGVSAEVVARKILERIAELESDQKLDLWGYATAMEATLALPKNERQNLFVWAQKYAGFDQADAFEYASTGRQLREVWQLDESAEPELAHVLMPLIQARQLQCEGGEMIVDAKVSNAQLNAGRLIHQAYLTDEQSTHAFEWLMRAIARGRTVARIDSKVGVHVGTGSLVEGSALSPALKGPVLMTNAHVLCESGWAEEGVNLEHAHVTFTRLDGVTAPLSVEKILFRDEVLDVCIAELGAGLPIDVACPVIGRCAELRDAEPKRSRIYIIGHPGESHLQYSFHDNHLVKFVKEENYLYYRSPTLGGSSGSPLFDGSWDLIGVHHSHDKTMPANCGTRIDRIRDFIARTPCR